MGFLSLCLSLIYLLHVTWESPVDFCSERWIPTNITQINGLWNLKAFNSLTEAIPIELSYSYAKVSVSEKEANFTVFHQPMLGGGWPDVLLRLYDETDTLTYDFSVTGANSTLTFIQPHPDSLVINRIQNGKLKVSTLYIRSISIPESELGYFKQWTKCNNLKHFKEFPVAINYAQRCHGLFEEPKPLHQVQDIFTSWHLVAKSSSTTDHRYDVKILYTARLEIRKNQTEYIIQEIITAPTDTILRELKYRPCPDCLRAFTFKTENDLLLLGIENAVERTLYLASRTGKVTQSVVDKFKEQAVCFETKYNYFIPGSIRIADHEGDTCADKLEQKVPINFRESIGNWVLAVAAHKSTEVSLPDILPTHGITQIDIADDNVQVSQTTVHHGTIHEMEHIEVEENTGYIIYKDIAWTKRTSIHKVSSNCIMFSPELLVGLIYLNCRSDVAVSVNETRKFVEYANCRKYNNIFVWKHASLKCTDLPVEVKILDVQKITGMWKLAAVASNVPQSDVLLPPEIQFIVNNEEIIITDGTWRSTAGKIGDRRLQFAKVGGSAMEMRFYEPLGDTLLSWVGNEAERKIFLVLFSKSGHADPGDTVKFRYFASCLSIDVTFSNE
ncbi:uncharacterized protein LOC142102050 [Mixophyes fleayi]|uniref:uncharacterized protein LOC142102050 n=1 Tax=Mixophyes fleayi TaxID=3061075 RepID=UPI003F4D8519